MDREFLSFIQYVSTDSDSLVKYPGTLWTVHIINALAVWAVVP